ncbi:MAG: type IV pilus assembly protein PilM [Deltaproteobacteria bacterium]|nr:type IV pilus assembly protein PilM [Deltaproteobacteria bacterium]
MLSLFGKDLIGIDLGSYSLKVVWLKAGAKTPRLKTAASWRLPPEARAASDSGSLAGFLSGIASAKGLRGRRAAALMTGRSLIFRQIYLPVMPEADLREAVKWEIKKEGAIPEEEIVCDYCHASTDGKAAGNLYSLIAFAARKTDVEALMSGFGEAGIGIRVVDAVPTALLFTFNENNVWEDGVNYGVVDIGHEKTTLVILKDRKLAFVREIAFGGIDLTKAVVEALALSETEAEERKISCGLGGDEPGQSGQGGCSRALAPPLERFATELHRSFDFYQAQFRGGAVSKLFLSGATAMMPGIDSFVAEAVGMPSFVDDPLRKIGQRGGVREAAANIAPALAVATGMALRMSQHDY